LSSFEEETRIGLEDGTNVEDVSHVEDGTYVELGSQEKRY